MRKLLPLALLVAIALTGASWAVAATAAVARPEFRGAQVHSLWSSVSSAQMTQELDALQAAGVNVLRVDVGWATLETAKGRYDATYLAQLDELFAGAQARGIKLIATLWQTPPWASAGGAWNDAPSNPGDYGNFARYITSRYGTELAAVEAWNEPQLNNNLIAADLPATYTQMVKAFYAGAKAGNPGVEVLAGSLAYADIPFLQALYANGIKGNYDGISVHPYADGADPGNTSVAHSFLGGIQTLHAAQQAAGDNTAVWVTEFGWPVGSSSGASSEAQQADYTLKAFGLLDSLPYVKGATIYQLRDMGSDPANPEDNFGLLHQDFTPRPAYAAFKAAMLAAPGTIATTSPSTPSLSPTAATATETVVRAVAAARHAAHRAVLARVSGTVRGATQGQVTIQTEARRHHRWVQIRGSAASVDRHGRFAPLLHLGAGGRYRVRAVYSGAAAFRPSRSTYRVVVLRSH